MSEARHLISRVTEVPIRGAKLMTPWEIKRSKGEGPESVCFCHLFRKHLFSLLSRAVCSSPAGASVADLRSVVFSPSGSSGHCSSSGVFASGASGRLACEGVVHFDVCSCSVHVLFLSFGTSGYAVSGPRYATLTILCFGRFMHFASFRDNKTLTNNNGKLRSLLVWFWNNVIVKWCCNPTRFDPVVWNVKSIIR